ncbi:hypothetical protein BX666DRAFT_2028655 [Dichotomocladium elegans]|nr:hypothetical protein BX666DRAFT_2028655 [Dichotomocladium elegans]
MQKHSIADLDIQKTALYNFITEKCRISLKRSHFQASKRNILGKIEARYTWVAEWRQTDMGHSSNCVFVDEGAFHINMKRLYAWSTKDTRATVKVPITRAVKTIILSAISPFGMVNISVKRPKSVAASKKRKTAGSNESAEKTTGKRGTVTGHYLNSSRKPWTCQTDTKSSKRTIF